MNNKTELGKVTYPGRGFEVIEFKDRGHQNCTLQQSSAIGDYENSFSKPGSSFVWLGYNEPDMIDGNAYCRMHLDREQAQALINHLTQWLKTGSLRISPIKCSICTDVGTVPHPTTLEAMSPEEELERAQWAADNPIPCPGCSDDQS